MRTRADGRLPSGQELRRLLVLRQRIRDEVVGLPRDLRRDVLSALEQARRLRLRGVAERGTPPEMTAAELLREIKWRTDSAAVVELTAAARALDRAHRMMAARLRRLADRRSAG